MPLTLTVDSAVITLTDKDVVNPRLFEVATGSQRLGYRQLAATDVQQRTTFNGGNPNLLYRHVAMSVGQFR
jgi:hypothetical protein